MLYDFYDEGHRLAFCFPLLLILSSCKYDGLSFFPMCRIINVGYCINVLLQCMAEFLSRLIQGIPCFTICCVTCYLK